MENDEHVRRLGRFLGVASLERNLAMEDEAVKRAILGQSPAPATAGSQMLAARDATVNNNYYYGQAAPATVQAEPAKEQAVEPAENAVAAAPPLTKSDVANVVLSVLKSLKKQSSAKPTTAAATIPVVGRMPAEWPRKLLYSALAASALALGVGTPLALLFGGTDTDTDTNQEMTFPE